MKKFLLAAALLGLVSCKSNESTSKAAPAMAYKLDAAHSTLSAVAMKNEVKPVTLKFPKLDGGLSLSPFNATLNAGIDTLETGDPARDKNVRELFFEIAKAANKNASIELTHIEGNVEALKEGESLATKAQGALSLHGKSLALSGPLDVKRLATGFSASFKDAWTINIKDAGMLDALANLNKNCPQPHRVGLDVKLSGELVFVKL